MSLEALSDVVTLLSTLWLIVQLTVSCSIEFFFPFLPWHHVVSYFRHGPEVQSVFSIPYEVYFLEQVLIGHRNVAATTKSSLHTSCKNNALMRIEFPLLGETVRETYSKTRHNLLRSIIQFFSTIPRKAISFISSIVG